MKAAPCILAIFAFFFVLVLIGGIKGKQDDNEHHN